MQHVTTTGELHKLLDDSKQNITLLQFSSDRCPRCEPFTEAVTALQRHFAFSHVMCTVTESEELVEAFEVSKLPAFVILPKGARVEAANTATCDATVEDVRNALQARPIEWEDDF